MVNNISLKILFTGILAATVLITFATLFFVLEKNDELTQLNKFIYKHPFAVSNAVRDATNRITSMHRHMKDVVLAKSPEEMKLAIQKVSTDEKHVFKNFDLIKERFLGSHKLIDKATQDIINWKNIRSEVLSLMRDGKKEAAAEITKGKGAMHVLLIERDMEQLLEFANNKADEFHNKSLDASKVARQTIFTILTILMAFSFAVTLLVYRLISKQLLTLSQAADLIKKGDYSARVPEIGTNEIGKLAVDFEKMRKSIALSVNQIEKAKEEADHANMEKSRFLANMSHELRTPMHSILSFSSLALKKADDKAKVIKFLNNIRTSGIRLTSLLNDLLDLAKLESGKMEVNFDEQDITTLLEHAINEVSGLLSDKKIQIKFDSEKHFECMVDQKLMTQVIINLLSNSIKFSPQNSSINIYVEIANKLFNDTKQNVIKITLIDEGIGIPPDELDSVFDKFIQSSKTKSKAGGTGLGLPITKEIIEQHHGKIWAESPPVKRDNGTSFHIEFPVLQGIPNQITFTNLQDAINSHQEWVKVIDDIFLTKEVPSEIPNSVISNETLCSLGQWINSGLVDNEHLSELKIIHKEFHMLAGECVAYCEMDNYSIASKKREDFHAASKKIIQLLESMNVIVWSSRYSVGVEMLDNQHKEIIQLINNITVNQINSGNAEIIGLNFDELAKCVAGHLDYEETLLSDNDYSDLNHHKQHHADYLKQFKDLSEEIKHSVSKKDLLNLRTFLLEWWEHHILEEDMKYKPFFDEKGIK